MKFLRSLAFPSALAISFVAVLLMGVPTQHELPIVIGVPLAAILILAFTGGYSGFAHLISILLVLLASFIAVLFNYLDHYNFLNSWDPSLIVVLLAVCALASAVFFLTVDGILNQQEQTEGHIEWFAHVEGTSISKRAVLEKLTKEVKDLRRLANIALGGVGFVIFVAVFMVLFAGAITSLDLSGSSRLSNAREYRNAAQLRYDRALERFDETKNSRRLGQAPDDPTPEMQLQLNALENEVVGFREERDRARALYEKIYTDSLGLRESSTQNSEISGSSALIASAVTRFGVIVILMFFAQALVNLYRYSMRLSSSYNSIALALALSDEELTKFDAIASTMSASHIDMGKSTAMNTDELKKIADIVASLK